MFSFVIFVQKKNTLPKPFALYMCATVIQTRLLFAHTQRQNFIILLAHLYRTSNNIRFPNLRTRKVHINVFGEHTVIAIPIDS